MEHGVTHVNAQARLVTSASQPTRPGGNYMVPGMGLWFDWNLALLARHRSVVDIFGTVATTGAISPGMTALITNDLTAEWYLGTDEPRPETSNLLAQVAVAPCTDAANPCAYDYTKMFYVTELMRASSPKQEETGDDQASSYTELGCLSPMQSQSDFELRQLTVIVNKSFYHVFGCVVSDRFASFQSVSFDVDLLGDDGAPVAVAVDGNTRNNIEPLIPQRRELPRLVALLAVDIQALQSNAAEPKPVSSAATHVRFYGCTDVDETNCRLVDQKWSNYPVRFEHAGK
jgi:hypothetical protein